MAEQRPTTTLIVPCFDEEARLDPAPFLAFVDQHPDVRLLFVDDGSTDGTRALLLQLATERPDQLDVLGLSVNAGKAEAVRRGMLQVLSDEAPTYVGYWDADLATPLEFLPDFAALLQARPRLEMVLGARVKLLGREVQRQPLRHYFGRVAATAASTLLGLPVYDTQCGAKLLRVGPHTRSLFAEPFSTRWAFDVELLARWRGLHPGVRGEAAGDFLVEVPLLRWLDVHGSKVRLTDLLRAPWDLARIAWRYRRELRRS